MGIGVGEGDELNEQGNFNDFSRLATKKLKILEDMPYPPPVYTPTPTLHTILYYSNEIYLHIV